MWCGYMDKLILEKDKKRLGEGGENYRLFRNGIDFLSVQKIYSFAQYIDWYFDMQKKENVLN